MCTSVLLTAQRACCCNRLYSDRTMSDVMMSESSRDNFSSSINATTTETVTGSLTRHVSAANPVIVRATVLLIMALFNVGGNGFTLITIRLTHRLWTKTNFILASMLVADIITGVCMFWYAPFLIAVYVFNNPCHYNVAIAVTTPLFKLTGLVSMYHLILISVERYIAIVYPLHYENKFTDRTLKWSISAGWVFGILIIMMSNLWLINADLRKCDLIPVESYLLDIVVGYIPVCISMVTCYGRILLISWRQRRRVQPMIANAAPGVPVSKTETEVTNLRRTQSGNDDNIEDRKQNPPGDTAPPASAAVASGTSSEEQTERQRQKIKSRRREFKAVYLTGAIVGAFVILWFPNVLGRVLARCGHKQYITCYHEKCRDMSSVAFWERLISTRSPSTTSIWSAVQSGH